jgi:hypothetical protein
MAYVLPAGSTMTATYTGTGSPITLNVVSITGATKSMAMAETTLLSGTSLTRIPSRVDPGTVQFECYLDDTATASNYLTYLKTCQTDKKSVALAVGLAGTTVDDLLAWTGYISEVTDPQIALGDDVLRFSVTLQVTA